MTKVVPLSFFYSIQEPTPQIAPVSTFSLEYSVLHSRLKLKSGIVLPPKKNIFFSCITKINLYLCSR